MPVCDTIFGCLGGGMVIFICLIVCLCFLFFFSLLRLFVLVLYTVSFYLISLSSVPLTRRYCCIESVVFVLFFNVKSLKSVF